MSMALHSRPRFSLEPTTSLHDGRLMKPSFGLVLALLASIWMPCARAEPLQPFVATYQAYNEGKLAGNATMRLTHNTDELIKALNAMAQAANGDDDDDDDNDDDEDDDKVEVKAGVKVGGDKKDN